MKTTNHFKNTIKAYLDKRAAEDALFAEVYAKENKNIDECCNYISSEVQKSGCNGFADEEIYSMAVHYYDEDNIKVGKAPACRVVVNHTIELTEEEKQQAKENAMKVYQDSLLAEMTKKPAKPKAKKEDKQEVQQLSLF